MNTTIINIADSISGLLWNLVIILAIILALVFGFKTKFIQFRHFKDMISMVIKNSKVKDNKNVSGFKAVMITLGGSIGTGNVAGVAMAIAFGGPGSIFWMWIIALLGAVTSFIENTLAQVYKVRDGNDYKGGPMFYMEKGLNNRFLGLVYAFCMIVSLGFALAALQMNTISLSMAQSFGISNIITSLIVSLLIAAVIFGGIRRIANVASSTVPFMTLVYFILTILVLITNARFIPEAISLIFTNAFGIKAVTGAVFGTVVMEGLKRGIFSNAAGQGDAPTAGASSHVSHPAKQGLYGTFSVFIDTIVVCTLTGIAVIISKSYINSDLIAIELAQYSFTSVLGSWSGYIFSICIALFCFTSIMSNYFCGETCLFFIAKSMKGKTLYRIIFVIMIFIGGITEVEIMWKVADVFCALLVCINMISLFFIGDVAVKVGNDYTDQIKKNLDPVFYASNIPGLTNTECWDDNRDISGED